MSDQLAWGYRSVESAQGYVMLGISRFSGLDGSVRNDSQAVRYACCPAHAKYPDRQKSITFLEGPVNHEPGERNFSWERGGFAWYENRDRNGYLNAVGFAPFWCFAGATAVLPLGWTVALWSRRRRRYRLHDEAAARAALQEAHVLFEQKISGPTDDVIDPDETLQDWLICQSARREADQLISQ